MGKNKGKGAKNFGAAGNLNGAFIKDAGIVETQPIAKTLEIN